MPAAQSCEVALPAPAVIARSTSRQRWKMVTARSCAFFFAIHWISF
jgi:hypothetical protein